MSDRYVVGNIVVITLCIKSYVFALLLLLVIFYRIVLNSHSINFLLYPTTSNMNIEDNHTILYDSLLSHIFYESLFLASANIVSARSASFFDISS